MDGSDERYDARWPLVVLAVVTLMGAVIVAAVLLRERVPDPGRAAEGAPPTSSRTANTSVPTSDAVEVLRSWDRARARAWATGDLRGLRALYVAGSVAGQRDVRMLRSWTERGLRVEGMRTQVLALREVRRTDDQWVLRVTDRVVGGVAVGPDERVRLPTDAASTQVIRWERNQQDWRVAAVREVS